MLPFLAHHINHRPPSTGICLLTTVQLYDIDQFFIRISKNTYELMSTGTTNTTQPTGRKVAKKSLQSLGNILHYLEGTILMVELKTGHCHLGRLLSSTNDMNLILVDVIVITPYEPPDIFHQHCNNNYKLLQYYHQTISSQQKNNEAQESQQQPLGNSNSSTAEVDTVPNRTSTAGIIPATTYATHVSSVLKRPLKSSYNTKPILQLVHIRGSKIRYIHFIDHNNNGKNTIHDLVQIGIHREKFAKQQYQRGIRK